MAIGLARPMDVKRRHFRWNSLMGKCGFWGEIALAVKRVSSEVVTPVKKPTDSIKLTADHHSIITEKVKPHQNLSPPWLKHSYHFL